MKEKLKYKIIIGLMITIITILHYLSGVADSPLHQFYRLLYFIPVIFTAFNFGFKGAIIISLIVGLIYSPHALLSIGFKLQTLNEFLDLFLFFIVAAITGTLVEKKNIAFLKLDNQLKKYVVLERYTNGIIESIRGGIIAVNNDMLITIINQGVKDILNVKGDCVGQNLMEVLTCCESIKKNIVGALEKNEITKNVELNLTQDNNEITIEVSIFPLNYESANKGIVIIIDDITDIKKLQQQMQRNDKLAALGELSTGVAHEIRNPLAIIKMIGQTMQSELKDNDSALKELEIIDDEVERANKVIKSLMEFGKPSKNEKTYCSLNSVIEEVLIIANKYNINHGVNVEFKALEVPYIYADKEQLKQAFINIIFNAVDAMPNGGDLSISTEEQGDWVKAIFKDNGEGVKEEDLQKIFNPFFTTKDQGTGLGLPIVHRIIEEHRGIINVYSKVGEGTRFEIFFPVNCEGR